MNLPANTSDRVEWIDAAKGIGIILVVLGHIWLIGPGQKIINSFHMPLFFFLSGYGYYGAAEPRFRFEVSHYSG